MLFFASFNMVIPELPSYLTRLGGAEYKGLIIALFTLTAMTARPFSGKLADTVGRVPVMITGACVCFLCSLLYPLLTSVVGFFLLRLIHGFSTGFTPTGQSAYLADVIPAERRGEAVGLLGTAGTLGMALGPAVGGTIANAYGLDFMFYSSSFCGLTSILILGRVKETLPQKGKFSRAAFFVSRKDLFEPNVVAPCFVMLLVAYAYGMMFTIIPDYGTYFGLENKGLIFTFITVASLLVRLLAGKASDIYGRVPVLRVSVFLIIASLIILGFAKNTAMVFIGASLYGFSHGSTSPTLLAWATDLSAEKHKGRGIGSYYIAMEFGIGMGAFCTGRNFGNDVRHFLTVFLVAAALSIIGFFYLLAKPKQTIHT
jgi:MFS family permease